ncbi:achaete-scute homolog 3-like [Ixodes scapularis]|uniref:achaete-scute homolog 3-like n=1 Tax=Ixodes scapularis TaxID=6945 RepID=UPI001C394CCD|nr:achaete-scute homolog 3-like [Ixodes scapularis]
MDEAAAAADQRGDYAVLTPMAPAYADSTAGYAPNFLRGHQGAGVDFSHLQGAPVPAAGELCEDDSAVLTGDSDDSCSDKAVADPFSPECKIPLPVPYSAYDCWLEPGFIRRRNERERQRVRHVNEGFERLRSHLPLSPRDKDKRLSKVETLRCAIGYIGHMQALLRRHADERENQ